MLYNLLNQILMVKNVQSFTCLQSNIWLPKIHTCPSPNLECRKMRTLCIKQRAYKFTYLYTFMNGMVQRYSGPTIALYYVCIQ